MLVIKLAQDTNRIGDYGVFSMLSLSNILLKVLLFFSTIIFLVDNLYGLKCSSTLYESMKFFRMGLQNSGSPERDEDAPWLYSHTFSVNFFMVPAYLFGALALCPCSISVSMEF